MAVTMGMEASAGQLAGTLTYLATLDLNSTAPCDPRRDPFCNTG